MSASVQQQLIRADESLSDFVYCFSFIQNLPDISEGVIIPNGRIDLTFSITTSHRIRTSLLGLETKPKMMPKQPVSSFFAINFNPLAVEYLFKEPIAAILNKGKDHGFRKYQGTLYRYEERGGIWDLWQV